MHPINEFGSDRQKEKYLPRLGWFSTVIGPFNNMTKISPWSQGRAHRGFRKSPMIVASVPHLSLENPIGTNGAKPWFGPGRDGDHR